MNHARDVAGALPGGELLIEEQNEIIAMLERLRTKKRYDPNTALWNQISSKLWSRLQLQDFSDKAIDTKGHNVPQYSDSQNPQMEVDSNASTPA
jgi:hypothetical protein